MKTENTHKVYGRVVVDTDDLASPDVFIPCKLVNKRDNIPQGITIGKAALGEPGNYTKKIRATSDVERYLPLVSHTVKQLRRPMDDWDDLYCIGCLGLVEAAGKFDTKRNFSFGSLAKPYIYGYIKNYQNPDESTQGSSTGRNEVSLSFVEERVVDEAVAQSEAMEALYRSLDSMTKKQREVMVALYIWGYTQRETAKALKINTTSVRRLRDRALENVVSLL